MESLDLAENKTENIKTNIENISQKNTTVTDESVDDQILRISNEIKKEENIILETTEGVNRVRRELELQGEEKNIPSIELNKNKKNKLQELLSNLTSNIPSLGNVAKIATVVGAGLFAGGNNLEANNLGQNNNLISNIEHTSNINIEEDEKNKALNGGNIEEVVVYGKKKYEEELIKQQENIKKFEAEMAKYQKDSTEWSQVNNSYNDSLKLYEISKKQLDKMMGMVHFIKDDGKTRLTAEEIKEKIKEIDPMWGDTFGQVEHGDFRSVADDYKGYGYAVRPNVSMSEDGQLQMNKSTNNKTWASEKREGVNDFINKTEKNEIKPKFAPILSFGDSYDPNNQNYNYRPIYDEPKGTNIIKPEKPENPVIKEIKYNPKFEDLRMRSLWATILKQDPNAKIGTLHLLDPEFEKGFTLEEAMSFPQEIKDQYNIDYIYNQIHGSDKNPKEDYRHPDWEYNNPTK